MCVCLCLYVCVCVCVQWAHNCKCTSNRTCVDFIKSYMLEKGVNFARTSQDFKLKTCRLCLCPQSWLQIPYITLISIINCIHCYKVKELINIRTNESQLQTHMTDNSKMLSKLILIFLMMSLPGKVSNKVVTKFSQSHLRMQYKYYTGNIQIYYQIIA